MAHRSGPLASGPQHDPYDRSKAFGEAEVRRGIEHGLDATILNPTGVIGPCDDRSSHMGQMFLDLQRRRIPALINGGFDWVDGRDVATAAETRGRCGANYVLSGGWHSIRELATIAKRTTGVPAPTLNLPLSIAQR